MTERGYDEYGLEYRSRIVKAWNNLDNKDLAMVSQQIANEVNVIDDKNPKETSWALIIKERDYKYDREVQVKCCYFEYTLPGNHLCILAQSCEQDN